MRRSQDVADALFPSVRRAVLTLTLGQPERWWYLSELAAQIGTTPSSLQRELRSLSGAGILEVRRDGRRTYYRAQKRNAIYRELREIVRKTAGVPDQLRTALKPLTARIRLALLYGSTARRQDKGTSDIDLLVVADDLTLEELFAVLAPGEARLGRKVHPTLYSSAEFERRLDARNHFLARVLEGPRVVLLGDEHAAGRTR